MTLRWQVLPKTWPKAGRTSTASLIWILPKPWVVILVVATLNSKKSPVEHPFARVFEGKPAAIARGDPSPVRREEAGAVVRHHVYPRKKLYVPTEDDVLAFPMMGTSRVTEFDSKEELHVDDFNQGGETKFEWWTGRTYFPLDPETPVEDFTYAHCILQEEEST